MADIQPFNGLRYEQTAINDLNKVICPPYDIISPALQEELHNRSEYSFVRVEHARSFPRDTNTDNKYTRAARVLQRWIDKRILVSEDSPAIYLHDHYFQHEGQEVCRRGLLSRVRLEEWEKGIIKPHENILSAARNDRLNLLWALQVNTSPILAMYEDRHDELAEILETQNRTKPVIDIEMGDGERHVIRLIDSPEIIAQIQDYFKGLPLYIADGHHRYTSALAYKHEKVACEPNASEDSAFNFILVSLINFSDPGMIILAPHRLITGVEPSAISSLESQLTEFFEIERFPLSDPAVWQKVDTAMMVPEAVRFGCLMKGADHACVLSLKPNAINTESSPFFNTALYQKLDVSVIDYLILERMLGLRVTGEEEPRVSFSHDRKASVQEVIEGDQQIAFFVKPVDPETIKEFSDAGEKMPRKSTYFFPKTPAGLVINPLC